jgi:branched-chain amino acid transport system permease protein
MQSVWNAQSIVNGLIAGSLYALVAVSFNLIYSTCRFFHFAHSTVIAIGAFSAYYFMSLGTHAAIAILLGISIGAAVGLAMNMAVYAKLREKGAQPTELLLASLGMMVAGHASLSLIFGDDARVFGTSPISVGRTLFLGVRLTDVQLSIGCISALSVTLIIGFVRLTRAGALIRAIANDAPLARAIGASVKLVINSVFLGGSAFAALAGVLAAYDGSLTPGMGLRIFLLGVCASIVGGIETYAGAVLGGLLIGLTENVGALWLPTQWQDASIFLVLIAFLLIRPQGLAGKSKVTGVH